ncbi:unnamed protein product [Cylicocyclus nassatus]|uniref:Apple domain-containing protein n=1 Tax=Cylicocyclus nassatus TaxID=53992 RepID=A0AA36H9N6_CYLNA|nr:unnamed protein product [Cylicocyclus nassatus]
MWTLVLLLPIAAVLSAPVNLPQTITCPDNNIFVYVNGSAHDRTPYIFVELNATDLHDCIHKCFGNQFCYSLKYESTAVEPCSLYYFAAYNCSGQKLVKAKEVQYRGGAITIDCLRCPANGDFVTAPPFDSFTEQTIVAKDAAGNPILSKPLDKVVTDNIELKLAPGNLVPVSTTEEPKEESTATEAGKENESTTSASTTTAVITAESRKMVAERKCSGSLKYRIQTDIDRETVQLLLNETTVESGNECAQLCYDLKCGFAYYKPSEKTCRFTSNTEDVVDGSSCDEASEHNVPEEEAVITCISCDIEASPAQNIPHKGEESPPRIDFSVDASPSPPTIILPAITTYPACIINFQLDEEADTLSFKHYEVKKVKSVNECARICFRGGCSTAVYSPQSLECRLGSELKETCTNAPSTIRYLKQSDVKIQCFRCSSPKHFAKEIEEQQAGTTAPAISHQEDQQAVSQGVDEAPPTPRPTSTENPTGASTPDQQPIEQKLNISDEQAPFGKNCIIKFQARPLSKRPAELNAPFELDLNVDSVELCATRCYQDGCSGARYDPSNGTCSLAYNDKHFCAKEPTVLHYKADEVTWIHCVNCYSDKDLAGSSKEPATKTPTSIIPVVLPGGTTTEKAITTETATSGPEESGTTQPSSKEGSEETTAKTTTSGTEATEAASSEGPEEKPKSTSAPESTPSKEGETSQTGATSTHKPVSSKDFLRGCLIKFQARPIEDRPSHLKAEFEISLTVDSVELCATRCYQDGCTGAKYDPEAKSCALSYNDKNFCTSEEVRIHYDAKNVTWVHCVNCYSIKDSDRVELAEQQEAAPEHVPVDEGGEKLPAAVEGSTTAIPEEIEPRQMLKNRTRTGATPHFQKKCAVKFQARPYSKRPAESKAPFEIEIPVNSIELCATRCYQDGCTGAKYDPKSKSCALSYADKHFCEEDSEVVLQYDAKEPTWIYCVNCYSVKPRPTGAGPEEQNVTEPVAESTASPSETRAESETSQTSGTAVPVLPGATTAESVGSSEGATTSEEGSSTAHPSSTESPREPETTQNVTALSDDELRNLLDKGCVVTFQIVELEERPPEFTASFDPSFETETAEICAYRCYQDGCTGAKYDPATRECALSYNDRALCSNAKLVQVARPQQPVFMHCFSCVPHLMLPNMTRPGPFSESIDNAPGTEEKPVTATAQSTQAVESTTPPSEAESSTPLGATGTGATTSPIAEAAVTEASGEEAATRPSESTTPQEEASGEEPLEKTTPAGSTPELSSTPAESESTATPQSSTLTVAVVFVPVEGATTAAPGSSEGTTEQQSSTITREEASGEEPSEKSTTPRIEASIDEVGSTESTAVSTTTTGNIATEETIAPKVFVKLEGSVTEPSLGETTAEEGTTSSPEEASGEEPAVKSTTPGEQVGLGGSTTVPSGDHSTIEGAPTIIAVTEQSTTASSAHSLASESTPEATASGARTDLTTPASTLSDGPTSATTSPPMEGFVTEASGEEATTEKSEPTTTHEESSGEEPLDKNAVPGVQASIDENATVQVTAESTPIGSSTTASTSETTTSPTQGTTLVPIVFAPAEGSTTQASTEQTTTEEFSTITPKEGASGEEPLDKSALPTVQASLDETTTEPAVSTPESLATTTGAASPTTPSATEESHATTPAVESFVTEASGEQSTTEKSETTATTSPEEASGEEPIDKTAVGEVLSGSETTTAVLAENTSEGSTTAVPGSSPETTPQGITIAPVAFIPVKATTEASTEQTATQKESTTSSPEEASGEGPLDKNAIPVVQANLDETTTAVAVEGTPETSPTTALGPSSSEMTTAAISSPAEAFVTEASGEESKAETSTVAIPPIIPVVSTTTSAAETSGEEPASSTNAGLGEEISVPTEATTGHTTVSTTPGEEASGEEPLDKNAVPKVAASIDETPSSTVGNKEEGSTTVAPGGETTTTRRDVVTVAPIVFIPVPAATTAGSERTTSAEESSTTPSEEASGEEPLSKSVSEATTVSAEFTSATSSTTASASGTQDQLSTTAPSPVEGSGLEASGETTMEAAGISATTPLTTEETLAPKVFLTETATEPARDQTATEKSTVTTSSPEEASGEEPLDKNAIPKVAASIDEVPTTTEHTAETVTVTLAIATSPLPSSPEGEEATSSPPAETTASAASSEQTTKLPTTSSPEEASGEEPLDKSAIPGVQASPDEAGSTSATPETSTGQTELSSTGHSTEETLAPAVSVIVESTVTEPGQSTTAKSVTTSSPEEASGEEPLDKNAAPDVQASLDETTTASDVTTSSSGTESTSAPSTAKAIVPVILLPEGSKPPTSSEPTTGEQTTTPSEEASGEQPLDKNALPQKEGQEMSTTTEGTGGTAATTSGTGGGEVDVPTTSVPVQGSVTSGESTTTAPLESSGEEPDKSAAVTEFTRVQGTTTPSEESSGEEPVISNILPKVAASIDEGTTKVFSTDEPGKASTEPSTEAGTEHSGEEPTTGQPSSEQSTTTGEHEATTPAEATAETSTVSIPPIIPVVGTSVSPSTSNIEEGRSSTVAVHPIIPVIGERENESTTPAEEASGEEPAVSKTPSAEESANESTSTTPSTTVSSANQEEIFVPTGAAGDHTTSPPSEEGSGEEPLESNKVPKVEASMDEEVHSTPTSESTTGGPTTTLVFILPGGAVTEKSGTTTPAIEASGEDPHHIPKIEPNINEITSTAPSSTLGSHESSTGSSTTVASEGDHSTVGAFILGSDQTRETTVAPLESSMTEQPGKETTPTNEVSTSPSTEGSGEESVEGSTPRVDFSIDDSKPIVRVIPGVIVSIERITEASPANTTHSQTALTTAPAPTTGDENEATSSTSEPQTTTSETEASGEELLSSTNLPKVEAKVDEGAIDVPSTEASKTPEETPSTSPATSSPESPEGKGSTVALPPVIPVIGVSGSTSTPSGVEEGGTSTVEIAPLIPATPVTGEGETSTAAMPPIIPVGSTTTPAEETSGEPTSSTNAGLGDEISVPEGAQPHTTSSPESTSTNTEEASGESPLESNIVPKVQASLDDGTGSANSPDKATEGPASTLHSTSPPLGHPHLLFGPSTTSTSVSAHLNVHATEPAESSTPLNEASGEEPSERQNVPETETSPKGSSTVSPSTEAEEAEVSTTAAPSSDHSTQEAVSTLLAVSEQSTAATSSQPGAAVTEEAGEKTTPQAEETTTSSVEGSGEEEVTVTTPKLDSSTDETRSNVRIVPALVVSVQRTTEVPESTGSELSSHPTSTTSSSVEGSGEESESGKAPIVEASVDDSKTTVTTTEPSEKSTRPTSETALGGEGGESSSTMPTTTISSADQEEIFVPTGAVGDHTTMPPTEEGSGETPIESNIAPKLEASHDGETSTESASTGHASTPSEPLVFLTDSPDGKTITESTAHSSTPSEPLEFITDKPDGKGSTETSVFITDSPNVESHSTTRPSDAESPALSHPLDSSFVHDVTPSTSEDLINRTLLEPHKTSLPINVGFVPGSEPDTFTESEEEEEESENTELTTQPDYEDAVASKKSESTSVATSTTAEMSTTTEPPVQAVQDLIDALAAGGLNAVLGPPRQTQLIENVNSKLGDLKKYLHKPLEQKQDCPSRRLRFVASELTDLSTRFSADAAVYSLQHCARMCYETGCTLAAFTRFPRPVCLMRYGNSTTACDSGAKRTSFWSFASVQQVVKLECIECEKNSEFITQKEQIDITNLKNGFSTDDLNTVVPAHEGLSSKCDGRLEFQTLPVGSLPRLNITNDVPARTPADCAKKCFEAGGCSTAGFIASPTGNISHGVCLLTSDTNVCGNNADYVPQHAALNPFVISCIKCTPCTYNIRSVTPDRVLPEFNHAESVSSIGECARACYARRCTIAQYSSQQKSCMMTSEPMDSQCAREVAVVTEGVLPVTLECVSCSS